VKVEEGDGGAEKVVDDEWVKPEPTVVTRGVSEKTPVEGVGVRARDGPMKVS
jgi:hypothetical protein